METRTTQYDLLQPDRRGEMTAAARITQADMDRATKAVAAAGFEHARIIMDLDARRIEIIIGEAVDSGRGTPEPDDDWEDNDV